MNAHAFERGGDLLIVADIAADAQRRTAGVLDFEMAKVKLRFAARQESDTRTFCRETDRQPFSDSASGAGH